MIFMNQDYYIIVAGNLLEGYEFLGPFTDRQVAMDYGNTEFGDEKFEWNIVELIKPGN